MANLTVIHGTDIKRDTVAVLNANFQALNEALSIANRYAANLNGVTGEVTVTHNLGTADVVVQLWDTSGVATFAQMTVLNPNSIRLTFNSTFSGRVVVL